MLDLDRVVSGRLLLRTVPGAVDYLAEDVRVLPGVAVVGRRGDAVVVDYRGSLGALANVPYFSSAAIPLPDGDPASLLESAESGVLAALDRVPVTFRVGDVGDVRWRVRDDLIDGGWRNEPGAWEVNVEPDDEGLRAEIGALHWSRRYPRLRRAPASTNPVIAAVMIRLAKIENGQAVLDSFCGAGTLLVSAALFAAPERVLGGDHDRRWVAATADNLRAARTYVGPWRDGVSVGSAARPMESAARPKPSAVGLWRGDARAVPLGDGSVDRIVSNLPFGKRVGSHIGNTKLYPAVLTETARLLTRRGRAVFLTEDKRLFTETVQRTRGLRIIKQIGFTTGGAHPSAYVVTTRRTR